MLNLLEEKKKIIDKIIPVEAPKHLKSYIYSSLSSWIEEAHNNTNNYEIIEYIKNLTYTELLENLFINSLDEKEALFEKVIDLECKLSIDREALQYE